jgi:hypothetical protein
MLSYAILVLSLSLFPFFSRGAPPQVYHHQLRDTHGPGSKRDDVVVFVTAKETQFVTLTVTATVTQPVATPSASAAAAAANVDVPPSVPVSPTQPATESSNTNASAVSSQAASAPTSAPLQPDSDVVAASAPQPLVMAYYPDWSHMDPLLIDFKLFNWIDFAFAVPTTDFSLTWDDPKAPDMLRKLVSAAHEVGTKVKLSIGGWSGSR